MGIRERRSTAVLVLFVTLQVLGSAARAGAQSTDDDSVFDFSLPGARSRGMGGAFVAIADDATSVYSNPAGLTNLFRPEVSFEFRHWNFRSLAIDHGHAYGSPSMIGIDREPGIHDRESRGDRSARRRRHFGQRGSARGRCPGDDHRDG